MHECKRIEVSDLFQIPEEYKCTIAEIMTGIFNGKIAVPTLSYRESLELLIELGLEKLKNDYLCIINYFSTDSHKTLLLQWK